MNYLAIFFCTLFICASFTFISTSEAATRSTPVTVTNDATTPVTVTGSVNVTNQSLYPLKPIGVSQTTISACISTGISSYKANSPLKLSQVCSSEIPQNRVCTYEEIMLSPGKINIGSTGAIFITNNDMSTVITSTSSYYSIRNNEVYYTSCLSAGPSMNVICCGP